jgi:chemotaxis signal transduction protein
VTETTIPHSARYLVLRLAGREFAIPAARVHGLMQARGLDLAPAAGSPVRPFRTRIQGQDLPVLQPHGILRLRARPVSARSCLVLIGEPGEGPDFALLADSVSRLERVSAHLTRLEPGNEFASAQVRLGDKWRDVLDLDKLAAA